MPDKIPSMKQHKFKQCLLTSNEGSTTTTWMPVKHAKKDVVVRLKGMPGIWTVKEAYSQIINGWQLEMMESAHKCCRKQTDV